jgi:hypothetical protein
MIQGKVALTYKELLKFKKRMNVAIQCNRWMVKTLWQGLASGSDKCKLKQQHFQVSFLQKTVQIKCHLSLQGGLRLTQVNWKCRARGGSVWPYLFL